MKKLRALLFLMMAVVVGGVYATFTYYEQTEQIFNLSVGIDAVIEPEVNALIDIDVQPWDTCAFYTYDTGDNKIVFDVLGGFNVTGTWNVEGEQLESVVGKEIAAVYVKIISLEGVNDFVYSGTDSVGDPVSFDLSPIKYSTEEYFVGNVAFGENGSPAWTDSCDYNLLFENQTLFPDEAVYLDQHMPKLSNSDMWQAFANCFDVNATVNFELIFRPL